MTETEPCGPECPTNGANVSRRGRAHKTCALCKALFHGRESNMHYRVFCSKKCRSEAPRIAREAAKKEDIAPVKCAICETEFIVPKALSIKGRRKYCSEGCYKKGKHLKYREWYEKNHGYKDAAMAKKRDENGVIIPMPRPAKSSLGGRMLNGSGYYPIRVISLPEEYQVLARQMSTRRYQLEHRLVAAKKIGRPLLGSEFVHHINGIKTDNSPENLEVLSMDDHGKEHAKVNERLSLLIVENERLKSMLRSAGIEYEECNGANN